MPTSNFGWTYPTPASTVDVPRDVQSIAEQIDTTLGAKFDSGLSTARPAPTAGALYFDTDANRLMMGINVGGVDYWVPMPGTHVLSVRQTTAQTIPHAGVGAMLQFQAIDTDPFNHGWATNATKFQPRFPGRFAMNGAVAFGNNPTDYRMLVWYKNGTAIPGSSIITPASTNASVSLAARPTTIALNGTTDYVELDAIQVSGGGSLPTTITATHQPTLSATYAGP